MFEYTCPTCQTSATTNNLQTGVISISICENCGQNLRVDLPDEEQSGTQEGARPGFWGAKTEAAAMAALVGSCGLVGVVLAIALGVVGYLFVGHPSSAPNNPVATLNGEDKKKDTDKTSADKTNTDKTNTDKTNTDKTTTDKTNTDKTNTDKTNKDKTNTDKANTDKTEPVKKEEPEPPPPPSALTPEEVDKRLLKSTVWILMLDEEKSKVIGTGSGFLVDVEQRLVMTNHHVAGDKGKKTLVIFPQYNKQTGELIGESKYYWDNLGKIALVGTCVMTHTINDLALIQLDHLPTEPAVLALPFAKQSPLRQQQIFAMGGKPDGTEAMWNIKDGKVTGSSLMSYPKETPPFEATVVESSIPINHGNSGGPTVDSRCRLVAVSAMIIPTKQEGHIGGGHIDVRHARALMQDYFKDVLHKDWSEPGNDEGRGNGGLQVLIKKLKSGDKSARKSSVLALGALDSDAREAVPDLLKVLREDEVEENRAAALKALNQIGPPYKEFIAVLTEALPDKAEVRARRYAADALGRLGIDAKATTSDLIRALKDEDAEVRSNAATALGQIGQSVREQAAPELLKALADPVREVRQAAELSLRRMGKSTLTPAELRARLSDRKATLEMRTSAIWFLIDSGVESVPALADALLVDNEEPLVIFWGATALGLLQVRTPQVNEALGKALNHKDLDVRVCAAKAIGNLGPEGTLLPAYVKAISSLDEDVRNAAIKGHSIFCVFNPNTPTLNLTKDSLAVLKEALASPHARARWFAAYALGNLGADAAPAAREIRTAFLKEKNQDAKLSPYIRLEMLIALAEIGPEALKNLDNNADKFLDELWELARGTDKSNDKDPLDPRTCAALALIRIAPDKNQGKAAVMILVKALRLPYSQDPTITLESRGQMYQYTPPVTVEDPNSIVGQMHERVKKALIQRGIKQDGAFVALEIQKILTSEFALATGPEPQVTAIEKMRARKVSFQVLEAMGPAAASAHSLELRALIDNTNKSLKEHSEVKEAATAARKSIFGK